MNFRKTAFIAFFTFIIVFSCNQIKITTSDTLNIFLKGELALTKEREKIAKENILFTPIDEAIIFFNTFNKYSPELIMHTSLYKDQLLAILKDTTLIKGGEFDNDIIRLLYNVPLLDYLDVIDSVDSFYKHKLVAFSALECAIIQNNHLSLKLHINCNNFKLREKLSRIRKDVTNTNLIEAIDDILICNDLDNVKEMDIYQPPFFRGKTDSSN